mgnify:CR=1 FL=1
MDAIKSSIEATGMPPTRADIARELGFKSANAAEEHLKALAKKGVIELVAGASRGIRLNEQLGLPIIGRVAAGAPLLAQEHIDDYCDLSASFFAPVPPVLIDRPLPPSSPPRHASSKAREDGAGTRYAHSALPCTATAAACTSS